MIKKTSSKTQTVYKGWLLFFCGLCMGAADLVPGISGGTIAFILGFYQPLLDNLQTLNWSVFHFLFKGQWRQFFRHIPWRFILTLLAGIICSFVCLSNFFHYILTHEIYRIYLYATFLGLILASFIFCIRQIRVWKRNMIVGLCLGALSAYLLTDTTLIPKSEGEYAVPFEIKTQNRVVRNYDSSQHLLTGLSSQTLSVLLAEGLLQDTTPVYNQQSALIGLVGEFIIPYHVSFFNGWLVICGALAVCALLLPGISGSYILTLLGVYPIVLEAMVEFVNGLRHASFNFEAFSILWSLGIGIVLGALVFARLLNGLLRHYPNQSLALLSGFMIGAIRSVWPFWSYEYILLPLKLYKGPQLVASQPFFPPLDSPLVWQSIVCAIVGFTFVFALEAYVKRKKLFSI